MDGAEFKVQNSHYLKRIQKRRQTLWCFSWFICINGLLILINDIKYDLFKHFFLIVLETT